MKKIIIVIDSFKGCLSSEEVEACVAGEVSRRFPDCRVLCFPMADGGEGLLAAFLRLSGGKRVLTEVHDPLMRKCRAAYGVSADGRTAVIEMAEASGLTRVETEKRNPLRTTTYGTGELIRQALDKGFRKFLLGIGGSATNDAGIGMLQALGVRFYDVSGSELGVGGQVMGQVATVRTDEMDERLGQCEFTVACDVQNPFCGPMGAAFVFAPQKGASPEEVVFLDRGMYHLASVIEHHTGKRVVDLPGAGAAGGLGGTLYAFLGATLKPGIELMLDIAGFDGMLADADRVITGEGRADRQTLMGKVPAGVLGRAKRAGVPVDLLAGCVDDVSALLQAGFSRVIPVTPDGQPLQVAMQPETARANIRVACRTRLFSDTESF